MMQFSLDEIMNNCSAFWTHMKKILKPPIQINSVIIIKRLDGLDQDGFQVDPDPIDIKGTICADFVLKM